MRAGRIAVIGILSGILLIGLVWSVFVFANGGEVETSTPTAMAASLAVVNEANLPQTAVKSSQVVMSTNTPVVVAPTATAQAVAVAEIAQAQAAVPAQAQQVVQSGQWNVQFYDGATDQMKAWTWMQLRPDQWPVFPNIDHKIGDKVYPASQGVEYGMDESLYCQQVETCDVVVAAMHYRIITGDYNIAPFGSCKSDGAPKEGFGGGYGCYLLIVNVGVVTASFEDQSVDAGFTVTGRYWHGDYLPQAIWAVSSHVNANMLNMNTSLNVPNLTNAGANCSTPGACKGTHSRVAIISGNQLLVLATTDVVK